MKKNFIMISAVFKDGSTVDNDKIDITNLTETQIRAITEKEISDTMKWWCDSENEPQIMISTYTE